MKFSITKDRHGKDVFCVDGEWVSNIDVLTLVKGISKKILLN